MFVSGCRSRTDMPFSPCISQGLYPVCCIRSMRIESSLLADATNTLTLSVLGGDIDLFSGV